MFGEPADQARPTVTGPSAMRGVPDVPMYQICEDPALYPEAFHDITVGNNSWAARGGR